MASGAVRVAGSLNFKKYAPNFPRVAITHAAPGLTTSREQLQQLGLVAAPDPILPPPRVPLRRSGHKGWPDYQRCLRGAPLNSAGDGPDRSKADFIWCKWAIERGWAVEEVAGQLLEISGKAREANHGKSYALGTAKEAAAAVKRGRVRAGEGTRE
jgi:hypothetical protein